jgi:hypothetical protein
MGDYLSERERAMFAALPRYRLGSAVLEDRVVSALVKRGLLRRAITAFGRAPWRVLSQLSAAAAVLVGVIALGRATQAADLDRGVGPVVANGFVAAVALDSIRRLTGARGEAAALLPIVRRMGSVAAGAVVMLPADTVDAIARIARDMARTTYRAASLQLARTRRDTMVALARSQGIYPEPLAR